MYNKKIVATFLITIMLVSSISFGETTISNLYTIEKASDLAILNYDAFKTNDLERKKIGTNLDSLQTNINNIVSSAYLTYSDKRDMSDPIIDSITALNNARGNIEDSEILQREILKDTVKNLFVSIYKLECQTKQLDLQIQRSEAQIKIDRKKLSLGVISKYELEKNYNELNKLIRTKDSLKISIEKLRTNLKEMMGIKDKAYIILDYSFTDDIKVNPVGYESGYATIESANLKIETLLKAEKRAKNAYVDMKNRYPKGEAAVTNANLDLNKAELNLKIEKEKLPFKYEQSYLNLNDQLEIYEQKKKDFDLQVLDYKNATVQYKLGTISKISFELRSAQYKIGEIELLMAKLNYVSAKIAYEATIRGTN